jgi:recombinational DNA repair ATPase RecF
MGHSVVIQGSIHQIKNRTKYLDQVKKSNHLRDTLKKRLCTIGLQIITTRTVKMKNTRTKFYLLQRPSIYN